jgi:nucleoside triphosphate pyrophosphatase
MIRNQPAIYLASKSPRRKKLLQQLKLKFKVISIEIDEARKKNESPAAMVKRLSKEKLFAARKMIKTGLIITADTTVVLNSEVIGKPESKNEAKKMLQKLSGKTHLVYTGFSVYNSKNGKMITDYEKTLVTFRNLKVNEIEDYIKTGSPMDKAGAYGIQDDFGAVFIKKINGDYYNVVGLPISSVYTNILKVI